MTKLILLKNGNAADAKMTSREIAELTGKQHKDVMRDIRSHVDSGALGGRSFALTSYETTQGKQAPQYELDFRATMTIVTGYDVARRSAVIDRWIALEDGSAEPAHQVAAQATPQTLVVAAKEFRAAKSIAKLVGLDGNQAVISANKAVRRVTGIDCLEAIDATSLVAEKQERKLTPTAIGKILGGLSGQVVNNLLIEQGLQVRTEDKKYKPTNDGKQFSEFEDTEKRHKTGCPVLQLKWFESVIEKLKPAVAEKTTTEAKQ